MAGKADVAVSLEVETRLCQGADQRNEIIN